MRRPVLALVSWSLPVLSAACGTLRTWQEIETSPVTPGALFDAIEHIAAKNGYTPDVGACDRGLGTYQARWRLSHTLVGRPLRYRLRVEVDLDRKTEQDGYIVRYLVERQKVGDPKRSREPRESDWVADGQESEAEYLFGTALKLRLTGKVEGVQIGPKTTASPR